MRKGITVHDALFMKKEDGWLLQPNRDITIWHVLKHKKILLRNDGIFEKDEVVFMIQEHDGEMIILFRPILVLYQCWIVNSRHLITQHRPVTINDLLAELQR
ncbi:hypothetical protein KKA15_00205 [Patescibacteria group bacterium]|nr:hypothetical protein [Patescibacteria group bacterium]